VLIDDEHAAADLQHALAFRQKRPSIINVMKDVEHHDSA
jgi:hypothetical protein